MACLKRKSTYIESVYIEACFSCVKLRADFSEAYSEPSRTSKTELFAKVATFSR